MCRTVESSPGLPTDDSELDGGERNAGVGEGVCNMISSLTSIVPGLDRQGQSQLLTLES